MKNNLSSALSALGLFSFILAANHVTGQVMLSPVTVLGTDLGTFGPSTPLTRMIDQSGLDVPFVSGTTEFDTYFASAPPKFAQAGSNGTNSWQSDFTFTLPLTGYVDFDLGASYRLDKLAIWNRSVRDVTVRVSADTNTLATGQIVGNFTLTNHLNFPFSYVVDLLAFESNHVGRYLRFDITSAYEFTPGDGFAYAIIGEVVLSAVPDTISPTVAISLDLNGDAWVTFTGTLQSATNANGIFANVPGNPVGTYVIPKANLSTQQFFRAWLD